MAKSTAVAALASLSYKFQSKIREVGKLKSELKLVTERAATGIAEAETVKALQNELARLRLRNDTVSNELLESEKAAKLAEFNVQYTLGAYSKLQAHVQDVDGVLADLRDSVGNWKSLSAVLCVVGIAIGSLGTLAYIAQTAPL